MFDQKYQDEHLEELDERKDREKESRGKKKAAARPIQQPESPDPVEESLDSSSRSVLEEILVAE